MTESDKDPKKMSFYDIKDPIAYLIDKNNLDKIRSKTLRNFCKFYKIMKTTLYSGSYKSCNLSPNDIYTYGGSKALLEMSFIGDYIMMLEKLNPEIVKKLEPMPNEWISKRCFYDYANALKYILACDESKNILKQELFEEFNRSSKEGEVAK